MNTELLHMAMLVVFGNDYLINSKGHVPKNSPYIEKVRFIKTDKNKSSNFLQKLFSKHKDSSILVAESERQWYDYLKKNNCQGIKLILKEEKNDEHSRSAYANGVTGWMVNCIFDGYSEFWLRSWESDSNGGETKWHIHYYGFQENLYRGDFDPQDLGAVKEKLDDVLKQIGDFAQTIGCGEWQVFFDKGREALASEPMDDEDMMPVGYSKEARQLLSAVKSAWVFGGMGSWNDSPPYYAHGIGVDEEYNRLTSALYSLLLESMEAAVNSLALVK